MHTSSTKKKPASFAYLMALLLSMFGTAAMLGTAVINIEKFIISGGIAGWEPLLPLLAGAWCFAFWVTGFKRMEGGTLFKICMLIGQMPVAIYGCFLLSAMSVVPGFMLLAWYVIEIIMACRSKISNEEELGCSNTLQEVSSM